MEGLGFIRGLASSCVCRHASQGLVAVLHGDDIAFAEVDADLALSHCALEENLLLKTVGTLSGERRMCRKSESITKSTAR